MPLGPSSNNKRRGSVRMSAATVQDLNKLKDGLGDRLIREINMHLATLSGRVDAQAGHKGTVVLAPQKRQDANGTRKAGLQLNKDRVAGVAPPTDGSDAVNLDFFRSYFDCDWFIRMVDDCLQLEEGAVNQAPDCWLA